jgi:DNA-binding Xre family transcriptional regulator
MRSTEEIRAELAKEIEHEKTATAKTALRVSIEAKTIELMGTIACQSGIPLDRLEAICAAEKEGRCVVLPCKVGDTVEFEGTGPVVVKKIEAWVGYDTAIDRTCGHKIYNTAYPQKHLKVDVLTRASAEAAKGVG